MEDFTIDTKSIDYDAQHVALSTILTYSITIAGTNFVNVLRVLIELLDVNGIVLANSTDSQSQLAVNKYSLWEPCGMDHTHAYTEQCYLYTLKLTLFDDTVPVNIIDFYRIPHIGIRTIRLTNSQFLVNARIFLF